MSLKYVSLYKSHDKYVQNSYIHIAMYSRYYKLSAEQKTIVSPPNQIT